MDWIREKSRPAISFSTSFLTTDLDDPEMTPPELSPIELGGYRSGEEVELLDVIDNLRSLGLREQLSLPQLIVCGNQSSGKNSVLEAISGLKFPSNDTLVIQTPNHNLNLYEFTNATA